MTIEERKKLEKIESVGYGTGVLTGNMSKNQLYSLEDGFYFVKDLQLEGINAKLTGTIAINTNSENLRFCSVEVPNFNPTDGKVFIKQYLSFGNYGSMLTAWTYNTSNFNILIN